MYLIFASDGSPSLINTDDYIMQYSKNVNYIFACVLGIERSLYTAKVSYRLPDGTTTGTLDMSQATFEYSGATYKGWKLALPTLLTALSGSLQLNVVITDGDGNILVSYTTTKTVNASTYVDGVIPNINEAQYESLMAAFQSISAYNLGAIDDPAVLETLKSGVSTFFWTGSSSFLQQENAYFVFTSEEQDAQYIFGVEGDGVLKIGYNDYYTAPGVWQWFSFDVNDYYTASETQTLLAGKVNIAGTETITGYKQFSNGLAIGLHKTIDFIVGEYEAFLVGYLQGHQSKYCFPFADDDGEYTLCTTSQAQTYASNIWTNTGKPYVDNNCVKMTDDAYKVYATDSNGDETTITYDRVYSGDIVRRYNSSGQIRVPTTPSDNNDAASKHYVDSILTGVYKVKGTATVAELNAIPSSSYYEDVGDVYNVSDSGTLTHGSLVVSAGDNVVLCYDQDNSVFYWDKLAASVDLSGLVEKTSSANKVYATDGIGNQTTIDVDSFYEGSIVRRDSDNSITVPLTPTANGHASSKKYVDDGLSGKQATLVSGTNIKTINSNSILGSGDLELFTLMNDTTDLDYVMGD